MARSGYYRPLQQSEPAKKKRRLEPKRANSGDGLFEIARSPAVLAGDIQCIKGSATPK